MKLFFFLMLCPLNVFAQNGAGLYSGSFDPPTLGHKNTAMLMSQELGLEKLYVVAKTSSDEKNFKASSAERVALLRAMFSDVQDLEVIVVEEWYQGREEMTKHVLSQEHGDLTLLFGDDVYRKNYESLGHIEGLKFAVSVRQDSDELAATSKDLAWLGDNSSLITLRNERGLSSSLVRKRLLNGESISELVDEPVQKLMSSRRLYPTLSEKAYPDFNRGYRRRAAEFLRKVSMNHPTLLVPIDVGDFEPLQSLQGERDRLIRLFLKTNDIRGDQARVLINKLKVVPYEQTEHTLQYGRPKMKVFSCSKLI